MSDTITSLPPQPTVVTAAGMQPQAPAAINATLLAAVAATVPGYTANLPGSLVEDIGSTDTAALVICDQARVELVNSLTPYGANLFLLQQLGQIYIGPGSAPAPPSNTGVFVVFSGPAGFVIAQGFIISDGTYQYVIQDGGVVGAGGASVPLSAVAVQPGSWAVPAGTVTQIVTSVPSTIALTVTNPLAGTPGGAAQSAADYRAQVLQAGLAASQGMARYLKTLLFNVAGVQQRLVSVRQVSGKWEIIVGGSGDPYQIGYAIWQALFDVNNLTGSVLAVTGITQANPGVVTTNLNHGYTTGQVIELTGVVGMTQVNGSSYTATVLTETTFSIGVNTTGFGAYVSGGVVTPNLRNVSAAVYDYPDTYVIPFVSPPQQTVTMVVTWNTTSPYFVSATAIAQLASSALALYVNSIAVGQPINLFQLDETFQLAVAGVLQPELLTRLVFAVSINGISTPPQSGTGIIAGDPESYFYTTAASIVVNQG